MRPPSVYANPVCPAADSCDLLGLLHGPHRTGCRLVMILLSQQGFAAAQIAGLLGYDPSTVRRWIQRYQRHGTTGLADRPRSGRPRRGSPKLTSGSCGCWTSPRPGPSAGSISGWAAPPSRCGPCTGACARSPAGGPAWLPRATPTATRSSPTSSSRSATCPLARWCWPRTRPTSICCPGSARPGSPQGSASRS